MPEISSNGRERGILDCVGKGKVKKFAEIIAGVVLAGEISLGAAISSSKSTDAIASNDVR